MYLKKLEVVGFKSFAEKTAFEFEPGVTAIVGPNGCGKSNISDAIRWVLGEQRAKDLRGELMEDVIFNGTADAKPLGLAEVSLTLADDQNRLGLDLSEVVVSRRLFRSGESQYLINKKVCRLRDVQELFADTGIGTDAYSHFEQGKIDTILSSKPEDRREIFEEAAGVMKYKRDKKSALRKLEATEENLTRLNDILREVKRQINTINRQAAKARRYKRLLEELSSIEVGLLVRNRDCSAQEYNEAEQKHKAHKAEVAELNELLETLEEKVKARREELQKLETDYETLQTKKLDVLRNMDRENNNISLCEQRIEDAKNIDQTGRIQIQEMESSIEIMQKDLAGRRQEMEDIKAQKVTCDAGLAAKEREISEYGATYNTDEETLEQYSRQLMDLMRKEARVENEIIAARNKAAEYTGRLEKINVEKDEAASRLYEHEKAHSSLTAEKTELENKLGLLEKKAQDFKANIDERSKAMDENRRQLQTLEQKLTQATSQYNLLRSMQESYEGYYSGVKAVLQESRSQNSSLSGIHGIVGDILTVEKGYETAIETALGNRVQNIITESGADAENAIDFLKRERAGRATFLALDILKETGIPESELREMKSTEQGVLGSAIDFVSHDDKYNSVVKFLLSRTVVVSSLNNAINIARKRRYSFALVTTDGESITARGAISGGSAPETGRGILMRESQISELAEEKERLAVEIEKMEGLDETIEAVLMQLEQEQVEIARSLQPIRDKIGSAERETVRISTLRDSLLRDINSIDSRTQELKTGITEANEAGERLQQEAQETEERKKEIEGKSAEIRSRIADAEGRKAELQKGLTELRIEQTSLVERLNFLENTCKRLDTEITERRRSIDRKSTEMDTGKHHVDELRKNIDFIKQTLQQLEEEKTKVEQAIELVDEQRGEKITSINSLEDEVKRSRAKLRGSQELESELNVRITELRFSINAIDERLDHEYNITPNSPLAKRLPEDTNWEELETRIEDLRRKKESMGEVNMYAIEEQERLQERYDILTEQQNDLINAKESLLKVISKINTEAKKLFSETFEAVREEFKARFKQLFGGGRADLILLDDKDILECGIDIVVSPPGKKLQNISLLSGGEKVMTAVSLLFAIFKVKPSPFCLLDEVDAPLDDSNIGRFTETLHEFLGRSQFIIITHNRRTISMADVLYGITMEKSGISKVVSVRFREKHDPRQNVMKEVIGDSSENDIETAAIEEPSGNGDQTTETESPDVQPEAEPEIKTETEAETEPES